MKTIMMPALLGLFLCQGDAGDAAEADVVLATGMIRNAVFMDRSPEFTDLYLIRSADKTRKIVIYCNSAACYRLRTQTLPA